MFVIFKKGEVKSLVKTQPLTEQTVYIIWTKLNFYCENIRLISTHYIDEIMNISPNNGCETCWTRLGNI